MSLSSFREAGDRFPVHRHPLPGCRLTIRGAALIIAIATAAALVGLGVRRA